jgi:Ammonium Transporter Family
MTEEVGHRQERRVVGAVTLLIALCLAGICGPAQTCFAQSPKPDPAGIATGDRTSVTDAAGNPFVVAEPTDKAAPDYEAAKKSYEEYQAQAAKEPLATKLADGVGHLRVGTNFAWTLDTGYLVLFMQCGFALLTCGLVRKKNAAHLMMLNFAAYVFAFLAYYAVGFAFQFGAMAINAAPANIGGTPTLNHFLIGSGAWGWLGGRGFFLVGPAYDAGSNVLTLFQVVFMETAGYIIVGAICERITFWAFLLCELFIGVPIPRFWLLGLGWGLDVSARHLHASWPRVCGLRRLDGSPCGRRILCDGAGGDPGSTARKVWQRWKATSISRARYRLRGHRYIHSSVWVDGLQSRIDIGSNGPADIGRGRQYESGRGCRFSGGHAFVVRTLRQA